MLKKEKAAKSNPIMAHTGAIINKSMFSQTLQTDSQTCSKILTSIFYHHALKISRNLLDKFNNIRIVANKRAFWKAGCPFHVYRMPRNTTKNLQAHKKYNLMRPPSVQDGSGFDLTISEQELLKFFSGEIIITKKNQKFSVFLLSALPED
jgi:hypothetical protein